jgi:hypothetical protein
MFSKRIEELSESDISSLIRDQTEESIRLEYKKSIDLDVRKERKEAAKDVAAMANTAGGRIVYGIKERDSKSIPDGLPEVISPLADEDIPRRLEDVLLSGIHPRPRFRMRRVPIAAGGFVLVVEVYPSDFQVHMVTGFGDNRVYVRSEKRTVLMSEPELRERYLRLALEQGAIEDRTESLAVRELGRRTADGETILVVPVFGRPGMFNPRLLDPEMLRRELNMNPKRHGILFDNLKITGSGYVAWLHESEDPEASGYYVGIGRNGITRYTDEGCFFPETDGTLVYRPVVTLREVLWTLKLAEKALEVAGYWGPIRIYYRLVTQNDRIVVDERALRRHDLRLPPGEHLARASGSISEFVGRELSVAHQIMDHVWQHMGQRICPWFGEDGEIDSSVRRHLESSIALSTLLGTGRAIRRGESE